MNEHDIKQQADENFEDKLEEISDSFSGPCSIHDLEKMVEQITATLPKLNRNKIREEIGNMVVPIEQTPTTFDINKGLEISQAYKDRLVEILSFASREYKLRKRCVEMLFDANNLISKASSADKRRGESTMRYPLHLLNLEASEIFLREVEQILGNIKSASESVSRQGSLIQSQIQLGEYRKRQPGTISEPNQAEEIDYHSDATKLDLHWDEIS